MEMHIYIQEALKIDFCPINVGLKKEKNLSIDRA
jgi:hypothetical protein